jgi:hypothetical protein
LDLKERMRKHKRRGTVGGEEDMGIWQGVAMDSLKYHLDLPCPTLLPHALPCGRATPEMALLPFQWWRVCRAGSLQSSSTPLDILWQTLCHTPMMKKMNEKKGQKAIIIEFYLRLTPPSRKTKKRAYDKGWPWTP